MTKEYTNCTQSQQKENSYKPLTYELILLAESEMRNNSHRRAIFNVLMYLYNRHKNVYPSQEYIAKKARCSIKAVQRALAFFRSKGWLWTDQRHDSSLIYYFNPIFTDPHIRERLKYTYSAFKYFMLAGLFVSVTAAGAALKESVSLLYNKEVQRLGVVVQFGKKVARRVNDQYWYSSYNSLNPLYNSEATLKTVNALSYAEREAIFSTGLHDGANQDPKKGRVMTQRKIVSEVLKYIDLKDNELFQLDEYSDKQIETALFSFKKKGFVERPGAYLMGALRNMHDKKTAVKRSGKQQQNPTPQPTLIPSSVREEPFKREESIQEKADRLSKAYLASMQACNKFEEDLHMDRLNNPNVVFFKQCALKKMKEECDYLLKCIKEHNEQKS